MQFTRTILAFLIFAALLFGCGSTRHAEAPPIPFHVWITLKNEKSTIDRVMAMCNLAQKPNKLQVSYPVSSPGTIVIEYYWKRMDPSLVDKIKKACSKESDLISLDSQ